MRKSKLSETQIVAILKDAERLRSATRPDRGLQVRQNRWPRPLTHLQENAAMASVWSG